MFGAITGSTVAIFCAKKIVGKVIADNSVSFLNKLLFPKKKYINRLSEIIRTTINEFQKDYPQHDPRGDFYFFDSEIILSELANHYLFRTKYKQDYDLLKKEFSKYPRLIIPTDNELKNFFELFITHVNNDKELKILHIDENYKNEIFNISLELHTLFDVINNLNDGINNKYHNDVISIFTSNSPISRLINKTTPLDLEILGAIRSIQFQNHNIERHYLVYQSGINDLNKAFIKSSLEVINSNLVEIKRENPDIVVDIKQNEEIQFHTSTENLTLKKQRLLWDCNCKIKFPPKYSSKPCPIHKTIKENNLSNNIEDYFSKGLVNIKSNGIEIFWKDLRNLWPPSIDSIYFIEDLKINNYDSKLFTSAIDIGCGTGYLGIWLAKNNNHIREIHFTDWLLLPLIVSYYNSKLNLNNKTNCYFELGLNTSWLLNKENFQILDLAICNPPYLPLITGREKFGLEMTVAGTELLCDFVSNWHKIAKEAVVSFSDIASKEVNIACQKNDTTLIPLGEKRLIPFRINEAYAEDGYISRLLSDKRIEFKRNNAFPYWHSVQSYRLEKK